LDLLNGVLAAERVCAGHGKRRLLAAGEFWRNAESFVKDSVGFRRLRELIYQLQAKQK
jgi:hypothetical protein